MQPSRLLIGLLSRVVFAAGAVAAGKAEAVTGGQVVGGNATITQPVPGQTTINQSSDRAIINWQNFNIGQGQEVHFNQPSASSATLNQVVGNNGPTNIQGLLQANGRVFIVDPNGVVFGRGSSVNVGGLVASTMGLNNNDFMSGANRFGFAAGSMPPGAIRVEPGAEITAKSFVALLGSTVSNAGRITAGTDPNAQDRSIAMVAANAATIQLGNWSVTVDQPAMDALVANSGDLVIGQSQNDGSILLNAAGRNALMRTLLTHTGTINNQSRGAGSNTALLSTGGVTQTGAIRAAGGKAEVRGSDITLDGNLTVGDDKTEAPSIIEIGGDSTGQVTQTVNSTIRANSKSDAQINIAAQKVLTLSGELLAPGGEISLKSTILDTGLLVPVADRINQSGVPVWTKLPLKTEAGLAVYYGVDGHIYAEDGRQLDGTAHLYNELGKDVGVVSDIYR